MITPSGKRYEGRVTVYVVLVCIVAACGGLIFGYDIGISGWFIAFPSFPPSLTNKDSGFELNVCNILRSCGPRCAL